MSDDVLSTVRLRDGKQARILYVTADDAAAMLEYVEGIAAESDFVTFGPGEFGITLAEEVAFLKSLADRSKGFMLQAKVDGVMVANCMITRATRPRVRHVGDLGLSVRKQFWGQGLAHELCKTLFTEAKRVGVSRIALRVRADNVRAVRLYERLGFAHEGRLVGAFIVGGVAYDELVMGLKI